MEHHPAGEWLFYLMVGMVVKNYHISHGKQYMQKTPSKIQRPFVDRKKKVATEFFRSIGDDLAWRTSIQTRFYD